MKKLFPFLLVLFLCNNSNAQNQNNYSLLELQAIFKHKNYTEKVLLDFQKTLGFPEVKQEIYEHIPGKIIAWSIIDRRFALQKVFFVEQDSIKEISVKPNDDAFLKKLNSYVPKKSRFVYGFDLWSFPFVKEKTKNGFYRIRASVKSFNRQPMIPNDDILLYDIEYRTKDFKKFQLLRLKDSHSKEWIEVND